MNYSWQKGLLHIYTLVSFYGKVIKHSNTKMLSLESKTAPTHVSALLTLCKHGAQRVFLIIVGYTYQKQLHYLHRALYKCVAVYNSCTLKFECVSFSHTQLSRRETKQKGRQIAGDTSLLRCIISHRSLLCARRHSIIINAITLSNNLSHLVV
jgi:hypothetical protein